MFFLQAEDGMRDMGVTGVQPCALPILISTWLKRWRSASTTRSGPAGQDLVVLADRQRLSQVLINLLSNGVKYNREGGTVTIGFTEVEGGRVRLSVTDTGAGIAEGKLQLLFQPFERLGADQTSIAGTCHWPALSRCLA